MFQNTLCIVKSWIPDLMDLKDTTHTQKKTISAQPNHAVSQPLENFLGHSKAMVVGERSLHITQCRSFCPKKNSRGYVTLQFGRKHIVEGRKQNFGVFLYVFKAH